MSDGGFRAAAEEWLKCGSAVVLAKKAFNAVEDNHATALTKYNAARYKVLEFVQHQDGPSNLAVEIDGETVVASRDGKRVFVCDKE